MRRILLVAAIFGLSLIPAGQAVADQTLPGPVQARVLEVIDGDTLAVEAWVWLGQRVETRVRLAGIDTPELRADCPEELRLAETARNHLVSLIGDGPVDLTDIRYGTYAGRVVARVHSGDRDAGAALLAAGLAVTYSGRGPRHDWCAEPAAAF